VGEYGFWIARRNENKPSFNLREVEALQQFTGIIYVLSCGLPADYELPVEREYFVEASDKAQLGGLIGDPIN